MEVQVNWLAVLLAGISSMVVGSIWYAKPVFGATWQKLVGLDDKKMKNGAAQALIVAFVMSLLLAFVLAHLTYIANAFYGNSFMQDALTTGFWVWLGISVSRIFTHDGFEQRPMVLSVLTAGNQLATIMVMALIIGWLKP